MINLKWIKWGGVAAVLVAVGLYVWTAEQAKERAARYKAELDSAVETAEANAEAAERLRAEIELTESLLAERERERAELESRTETLRSRLSAALQEAPDEVQECMPVRLPDAVLDSLYGDANDPEDPG